MAKIAHVSDCHSSHQHVVKACNVLTLPGSQNSLQNEKFSVLTGSQVKGGEGQENRLSPPVAAQWGDCHRTQAHMADPVHISTSLDFVAMIRVQV